MSGAIVVEYRATRTTGGQTWPAAHVLLRVLQSKLSAALPGARVLELGSGTGWCGLSLAQSLPQLRVTLTDQREQLDLLQSNAARYADLVPVTVEELDLLFPVPEHLTWSHAQWTLIACSDIVYTKELAEGLPVTLAALLQGGPADACVIMAHTLRRYDDFDNVFFDAAHANGLDVAELLEDGSAGPTPRAEEIELFPEQRIAVLRIAALRR